MSTHPDPKLAAVIATLRREGHQSARALLRFHPDLKDTVTSTRVLKGLVDQGYLQSFHEEGRNATFGIPAPAPASQARPAQSTNIGEDAALQADLDLILASANAKGELSISDAIALFPAKRKMTRGAVKHRLHLLIEQRQLELTGRTRNARYRPIASPAPAPATASPSAPTTVSLPCARAFLEAVQAERRMYSELLVAAMGSTDHVVQRLASAVCGMRVVVDGLTE